MNLTAKQLRALDALRRSYHVLSDRIAPVPRLNLYLVQQAVNRAYDTFGSAVVMAPDVDAARHVHPRGFWVDAYGVTRGRDMKDDGFYFIRYTSAGWTRAYDPEDDDTYPDREWAQPADVQVTYLGPADADMPNRVVCAAFRAG